jgi:hypothetical protein
MKYVKMLSLAAVAAMALMAFVGASSASATVFCKAKPSEPPATTGTTCPASQAYPAGTTTHEVSESPVHLTTEFQNIECKHSIIEVEIQNEGSATETPSGPVKKLTFEECNCSVTVLQGGTQEFHWEADSFNAKITSTGGQVTVLCSTIFGNEHCIYYTENTEVGKATGGAEAKVDIEGNEVLRTPTSALCAAEGNWHGTYKVESPKPLYFAAHT